MMEDNIFDISFSQDGKSYKGWVNPSAKLGTDGKPVSYHVVLNDTSLGYLSRSGSKWIAKEERPAALVKLAGEMIDQYESRPATMKVNPNPRANENIPGSGGRAADTSGVGSEITDGEDG